MKKDNKLVAVNLTLLKWHYSKGLELGQQFEINGFEYIAVHESQGEGLLQVITRQNRETMQDVYYDHLGECLMAVFAHITIGIEEDGYAHS